MTAHVTQAAEGLPRRAFSVRDIERMVEVGLIDPDERFELIGGEIVPMSPKGMRHERLKVWLNRQIATLLPDNCDFAPETTLRLSPDTYVEPDFVVYERSVGLEGLCGDTALLVIEIGDTSLAYDQGQKAALLAGFGVAELWVIDVARLSTRIHRDPTPTGYRSVVDRDSATELKPARVPGLSLRLGDHSA